MKKYGSWEIYDKQAIFKDVTVYLVDDADVFATGCHGQIKNQHKIAISGVCLFDASLCVVFETGAIRTIARGGDRKYVAERIRKKGTTVTDVIFPTELSDYHKNSIDFLAKSVIELGTEKLLYHVPVDEYKVYMKDLEKIIGKVIPGATEIVEAFAQKVKQYLIAKMKEVGFDNFEFIEPMKVGAKDPEESYSLPYTKPELFGASAQNIYAIEDLVELTIATTAEDICGCEVPVKFYVLGAPHPYTIFSKKNIKDRDDIIIVSV